MLRFRSLATPASASAAALILALCLLGARPAIAQPQDASKPVTPSPDTPAKGPFSLDALTVRGLLDQGFGVQEAATGTKTDTPLIEVPSTVNVINRQHLDSQQLLTLPEALQWVPGVFDQNSRSGFDRFTIRGFFAGDSVFPGRAPSRSLDGLDVTAFYAYIDGEITEDTTFPAGNRLPNTPKHSGGLWATWTFPSGPLKGLGAGAGFRYVGERPADLSNAVTLPDYVVVDASVFYRRGRLSLDLNFKNVTNETYFNGNGSSFIFPGEPFSVLGRVAWSF